MKKAQYMSGPVDVTDDEGFTIKFTRDGSILSHNYPDERAVLSSFQDVIKAARDFAFVPTITEVVLVDEPPVLDAPQAQPLPVDPLNLLPTSPDDQWPEGVRKPQEIKS